MPPVLFETLLIGAGTYLIRAGSLSLGSRASWPEWARKWLSFVTPAVLGALLGPMLLLNGDHWPSITHNPTLLAALPTAAVAWISRHLLLTVVVGVVCFALIVHI
ncbi:Branched-chain amino acid transport protein (AzlD) [Acididesulfobacillus acetoxydans]|uniref:Branched-chain amino acid transport protein (AzlD) n=1 Tax=Acididesulfobacillus acetoxydans TaxID=1561005 RepID=A0A8S0X408_9FIRM|nr:AzlD domain-containing protein [Acididesulfobacillus acetoxydans]CAA7600480.1 Branched-chain amino acid transport protein (AzlD) [Acididesulfobacillus acetoxydans]CEJ06614.1 Branched-chain amino acid transport protein (AzlD) [Acididesulfobacillus acetoxydans]